MLDIESIAVDHGKVTAVWDVSLRCAEGEKVALLGTNGAGKSTIMGAIMGLYPPQRGAIRFQGADITGSSPSAVVARGIALVPEGRRLFGAMTVHENLMMGAYTKHARASLETQLARVLEWLPVLKTKLNQPAGELSGGQQQMVSIGRALMSKPRLLLLDEPFIGVAPLVVQEMESILRKVADTGVSMVLVEQNTHRALEFVSRAYVVENGRCTLEGTSEELLSMPDFGEKFLGLD